MWPEPHDFIHLEITNSSHFKAEVADLYQKGLSLRDIEKRIPLSKTKIRDLLIQAQVPLRTLRNESGGLAVRKLVKRHAKPPYGFWYVNGKMEQHPQEYPVFLGIVKRWKKGEALNSIATFLNAKKVKSPLGKQWSWNSIKNITQRIESGQIIEREGKYELK